MSRQKRGGGADGLYAGLMSAGKFSPPTAALRENYIYRMYIRVLSELAMNRFKWIGIEELPGFDQRFIEQCLFQRALSVVYYDEKYEHLIAAQGNPNSGVNIFSNPTSFMVLGPGRDRDIKTYKDAHSDYEVFYNFRVSAYDPNRHSYLTKEEKQRKGIGIWANYNRYPDWDIVQVYASKLAEIDRTVEINSKNARRNKLLKLPPNQQLSGVNLVRQLDDGTEVVQVTGPFQDMDMVEAIDFGIDATAVETLDIIGTRHWNKCMGLLGIDNSNQDKKERLVSDEVHANSDQTDTMRFVQLNSRKQACQLINEVFDTNIDVEFNTQIEKEAESAKEEIKEVAENVDAHDAT